MNTLKINSKGTKFIAHRGLSGIERENTYPAFIAAGNRNYYGIETDIHVTKDGKFVVIHDETTKRVSNETTVINVEENYYSAVENLVLPDKDGSTHRKDIRIPLLKDYISICKKYEKKCVLELKNPFKKSDIKKLIKEIEKEDYLDNVIFISFAFKNCTILRELLENNDIQWLTAENITEEMADMLVQNRLNLDVLYNKLTKENIDMLHSKGIKVNCWTCDNPAAAEKLVDMGVDFITTNIIEGAN